MIGSGEGSIRTVQLNRSARALAKLLAATNRQLVLAESCTAGLVAATLAGVPGISQHLCGSAVVYQVATKLTWLKVDEAPLQKPGPVSRVVALQMAAGALDTTPHADLSASVTGHLGPNAPKRLDGVIYVGISDRSMGTTIARRVKLTAQSSRSLRLIRQREAAWTVLETLRDHLISA